MPENICLRCSWKGVKLGCAKCMALNPPPRWVQMEKHREALAAANQARLNAAASETPRSYKPHDKLKTAKRRWVENNRDRINETKRIWREKRKGAERGQHD